MSFIAEHWESLCSLLLSVVAIGIAIYSSRKTSREATKQIESIKELNQQTIENTLKEVESIKQLAKMQIEATTLEMDMEITKYRVLAERANEERRAMSDIQNIYQTDFREMRTKDYQAEQPLRDLKYHSMYIQGLREISKRLEQLKSNLK